MARAVLSRAVLSRLEVMEAVLGQPPAKLPLDMNNLDGRLEQFLEKTEHFAVSPDCPSPLTVPVSHSATPVSLSPLPERSDLASEAETVVLPRFQFTPAQLMRDELRRHLLSLGDLSYIGYSVDSRMFHVPVTQRDHRMSDRLESAICFRGIFFSTHPLLFHGTSSPSFAHRLQVASQFRLHFTNLLELPLDKIQTNLEACDEIRAQLVHILSLVAIGETMPAFMLLNTAMVHARMVNLFDPATFTQFAPMRAILTEEAWMDMIPDYEPVSRMSLSLSDHDRHERFSIVTMMMFCDTFATLTRGAEMMVDDTQFPDFAMPIFHRDGPKAVPVGRSQFPSLAEHTLWQASPFAFMVDDQKEYRSASHLFPCFSVYRDMFCYKALRLFRRMIRFLRTNRMTSSETLAHSFLVFHTEALELLTLAPKSMFPFTGLTEL
ncbi:hypothetical protein HDU91_000099, partial [Kappamyces sp. JEL0680]